jgi:uncharacterized protein (TIGR00369 family)
MNSFPDNQMQTLSPMQEWLAFEAADEQGRYRLHFRDQHIGNPFIRSVHGGVTASLIEMCAEHLLSAELDDEINVHLVSSSVDYLRITKDVDIHARAQIVRIGRRLGFVDVWCWQDNEDIPIARGTCTLRIFHLNEAR